MSNYSEGKAKAAREELTQVESDYRNAVAKVAQHAKQLDEFGKGDEPQWAKDSPTSVPQVLNQMEQTLRRFVALEAELAPKVLQARINAGVWNARDIIKAMGGI